MQNERKVMAGNPYPLGVYKCDDGINVSMVRQGKSCGIILYDNAGNEIRRIELSCLSKMGQICYGKIPNTDNAFSYQLFADDRIIYDTQMKAYIGGESFGSNIEAGELFPLIDSPDFMWEDDSNPQIPYEDSVLYCMHVRGFTKHKSSGVKGKGTFAGIIEKIPYLEELGITAIELLPVYELKNDKKNPETMNISDEMSSSVSYRHKVNYWGYGEGLYYAPKNSYSASKNADIEFKTLVKELHKRGMEVILQFYFPDNVHQSEILNILKYWRIMYHVDGFHLKGDNLPLLMIGQEPGLSDVKMFYYGFPIQQLYSDNNLPMLRNLAYYTDEYMYVMRRFLKGDEDMIPSVLALMRRQPAEAGQINYLTNYFGFTLADMVSYERKHNEENGENNRDGIDYNYTWNCGAEGKSRKKAVVSLRQKQIRNALCLLMFSQGTPLIHMGDEFGNSQNGNNNPYCQDNDITWLNWQNKEQNQELFDYVRELIRLRKAHPILHKKTQLRLMDYISCGFPDLSYHATNAWQPDMSNVTRHIGILYCGKYALLPDGTTDSFFYIAINMHWEAHEFALPKLQKGMEWYTLINTENFDICTGREEKLTDQQTSIVAPRSIQVYISK